MNKKVAFYTLGCKLNYSETSSISRLFRDRGFEKVGFKDKPDIFVINTCSVTENADRKCRKIVKEAKKISSKSYVVIVGCYAQLKPKEISEIPGVDAVLGASEKFRMFDYLEDFTSKNKPVIFSTDVKEAKSFHSSFSYGDRTRTFLKVQDGCNYGCSFCTIPLARGKSRSGSIEDIVKQAKTIGKSDVHEVVVTGVNIGDFGIQNGKRKENFLGLIRALDQVKGIDRIRISSIEPNLLSEEIIRFVSTSKLFVPHFHIPLQSGSDNILRRMNRRYLTDLYANRVNLIKEIMPEACIGVDVIAGFPGESLEEFEKTYAFLRDLDISYLHVFTYSERANTKAILLDEVVPKKDRTERSHQLRILSDKKRRAFYESHLGKQYKVLFEAETESSRMHGFTENYIRVEAEFDPLLVNTIKKVRLDSINSKGYVEVNELTEEMMLSH